MAEGFTSIITMLEPQKSAIERALSALAEVEGATAPPHATPASAATSETPDRKGKKRSAAVRTRMKDAQQLRWAKIKGESKLPVPAATEAPKAKRKISVEGMKRIIAATKKRWAKARAEAKAA
jgi:hypothetical protein